MTTSVLIVVPLEQPFNTLNERNGDISPTDRAIALTTERTVHKYFAHSQMTTKYAVLGRADYNCHGLSVAEIMRLQSDVSRLTGIRRRPLKRAA